jgi:hypothetical protein
MSDDGCSALKEGRSPATNTWRVSAQAHQAWHMVKRWNQERRKANHCICRADCESGTRFWRLHSHNRESQSARANPTIRDKTYHRRQCRPWGRPAGTTTPRSAQTKHT